MKKCIILAWTLILALSLCACGRNHTTTVPTTFNTTPSTDMNILPDTMPTLETNIPDPNVDTQMPGYTDGTDMFNDFTTNTTR